MERAKDIAIRALSATVAAVAITPTAETILQMLQNRTPIVEAQTTTKAEFPIAFPLVNTCTTPPETIPVSGTLSLREVLVGDRFQTIGRFDLSGFNPQGAPVRFTGEGLSMFDPTKGLNVVAAESLLNVRGRQPNMLANFAFAQTNNEIRANIVNVRCVGGTADITEHELFAVNTADGMQFISFPKPSEAYLLDAYRRIAPKGIV